VPLHRKVIINILIYFNRSYCIQVMNHCNVLLYPIHPSQNKFRAQEFCDNVFLMFLLKHEIILLLPSGPYASFLVDVPLSYGSAL
jgi:hypothetical protein